MPRTDADRRVHHPGRGHRPDPSAPPSSRHTRGASNARSARAVSAPRPAKRGEVRGPGRRSHRGATSVPACRALPAVTSNLEGKPARRMSRLSLLAGARVAGDHSLYSTRPDEISYISLATTLWVQPRLALRTSNGSLYYAKACTPLPSGWPTMPGRSRQISWGLAMENKTN